MPSWYNALIKYSLPKLLDDVSKKEKKNEICTTDNSQSSKSFFKKP